MSTKGYGNKKVYPTHSRCVSAGLNYTEYLIGQVLPAVVTKSEHTDAGHLADDTLKIVEAMIKKMEEN